MVVVVCDWGIGRDGIVYCVVFAFSPTLVWQCKSHNRRDRNQTFSGGSPQGWGGCHVTLLTNSKQSSPRVPRIHFIHCFHVGNGSWFMVLVHVLLWNNNQTIIRQMPSGPKMDIIIYLFCDHPISPQDIRPYQPMVSLRGHLLAPKTKKLRTTTSCHHPSLSLAT